MIMRKPLAIFGDYNKMFNVRIKKWRTGAGYFAQLELFSDKDSYDEILIDSKSVYELNQKLAGILTEIFGYS